MLNDPNRVLVIGMGGCGRADIESMQTHDIDADYWLIDCGPSYELNSPRTHYLNLDKEATRSGSGCDVKRGARLVTNARVQLSALLSGRNAVFVTGSLGGGIGAALAPLLGHLAREIHTPCFGLFTLPGCFEGAYRECLADDALGACWPLYSTVSLYPNDVLGELQLPARAAFTESSRCKASAVVALLEIIQSTAPVNLDMADVLAMAQFGHCVYPVALKVYSRTYLSSALNAMHGSPYLNVLSKPSQALIQVTTAPGHLAKVGENIRDYLLAFDMGHLHIRWSFVSEPTLRNRIRLAIIYSAKYFQNTTSASSEHASLN